MSIPVADVQKAYIAFFGRPADPAGLVYWSSAPSLANMYAGFAGSQEFAALYSGMDTQQLVEQVYQNLFGRASDPLGKAYWSADLDAGNYTISTMIAAMVAGAQGSDITTIANRVAYCQEFTAALDTPAEISGFFGNAAAASARAALHSVTSDASLATARASLSSSVAAASATATIIPIQQPSYDGGNAAATFALHVEDGVTTITGTAGADTIDYASATSSYVISGLSGNDTIKTGSSNDYIRPGDGVDITHAGAGHDVIVVIGTTSAGQYSQSDITNPGGSGLDLSNLVTLDSLNGRAVSELQAGEVIDGGTGINRLVIYGEVDLTGATITNVTQLQVNSSATMTAQQFGDQHMTTVFGDGQSSLNVANGTGGPVTVDYSYKSLTGIKTLNVADGVTLVLDQADVDGVQVLSGLGTIKASSATGTLDLTGKQVLLTVQDTHGVEDATHGGGLYVSGLILAGTAVDDTLTGGVHDDRIDAGAGDDVLTGGDGNDVLRGGAGVDKMDGGAGNDSFVIVGDLSGGGKVDSVADTAALGFHLTTLNGQDLNEDHDGATEIIAGGDGEDTLYVYGTADLSNCNITSIEHIEVRSFVTFNAEYLKILTASANVTINGDGSSNIFITGGDATDPLTVDLTGPNSIHLSNIGQITLGPNVKLKVDTVSDLGGATKIAGDGVIYSDTRSLDLTGISKTPTVQIKNNDGTVSTGATTYSAFINSSGTSIVGSWENEWLTGTAGNDTFYPGGGNDVMDGRGGNDTYIIKDGYRKTIVDSGGYDTIDFSQLSHSVSWALNTGFYFDYNIDNITVKQTIGEFLYGTGTIEKAIGTRFNDVFYDRIFKNHRVLLGDGDDKFFLSDPVSAGLYDGGAGYDIACITANGINDFTILESEGKTALKNNSTGAINTLVSVEKVYFSDGNSLSYGNDNTEASFFANAGGYFHFFAKLSSAVYLHTGVGDEPTLTARGAFELNNYKETVNVAGFHYLSFDELNLSTGRWTTAYRVDDVMYVSPWNIPRLSVTYDYTCRNGFYGTNDTYGPSGSFASVGRNSDSLFLTFRGTDQDSDWWDDVAFMNMHYAMYAPLNVAIQAYLLKHDEIKHVYVSGHSLGGQMANLYMHEHEGDPTYSAVTFEASSKLNYDNDGHIIAKPNSAITGIEVKWDAVADTGPDNGYQYTVVYSDGRKGLSQHPMSKVFESLDTLEQYPAQPVSPDESIHVTIAKDYQTPLIHSQEHMYVACDAAGSNLPTVIIKDGVDGETFTVPDNLVTGAAPPSNIILASNPCVSTAGILNDGNVNYRVSLTDTCGKILVGNGGNNVLIGGQGADLIIGGGEEDVLYGGAGNDVLYGGNASSFPSTYTSVRITPDVAFDFDVKQSIARYTNNGWGDDVTFMRGGAGKDTMWGSDGHDYCLIDYNSVNNSENVDNVMDMCKGLSDFLVFSGDQLGINIYNIDENLGFDLGILGMNAVKLSSLNFHTVNTISDNIDYGYVSTNEPCFIFSRDSGLYFDKDGSGPSAPVLAANIHLAFEGVELQAAQILLVGSFGGMSYETVQL